MVDQNEQCNRGGRAKSSFGKTFNAVGKFMRKQMNPGRKLPH